MWKMTSLLFGKVSSYHSEVRTVVSLSRKSSSLLVVLSHKVTHDLGLTKMMRVQDTEDDQG